MTSMFCKMTAFMMVLMLVLSGVAMADAQTVSGTASGMGEVKVELTVENGQITDAKVDVSNETAGFGLDHADDFVRQLLEAQSADIDGISGCTITTNAVKTAAAQALAGTGIIAEEKIMTPGLYIGSAMGAKSEVKVAVQVDADQTIKVWPLECNDTAVFSRDAAITVAKEIEENQSLAVDVYSGATLTSNATILAAANAIESAGGDPIAWRVAEPREKVQGEDIDVDVLIVGGGTSGLTAAISAKTDSKLSLTDSGLKVLVVERNSFAGGDLNYSGGYVATPSGNPLSAATGVELVPEDVTRDMLALNPAAADFASEALSLKVWSAGPDTITGLMNRGFHMSVEDARVVSLNGHPMTAAFTQDPVTGYRCGDEWWDAMTGAPYEGWTLQHAAEDAGVEIRLNTEATGLVIENNVCLGVTVEDRDSYYTITAKKVILATGYAGWDKESVEMFYPELSNVTGANNPGNHSDAQKWMVAMGGETVYYPESNYIVPVYNPVLRDNYEFGWIFQKGHTLWVNSQGKRFFDESAILNMGLTDIGALLCTLEDGQAWMIFDSNNADCVRFADELMGYGVAWSAGSVEELAEKTGLPADALKDTIEAYNAACVSGEDLAFGTPADFMAAVTGDTLYAARIVPGSTASVAVTLYCDDDMTITMTKGGQRIENLMGAGGVVGNMVPVAGFGAHVYEALSSGTLAGEIARTAILGE
ncbi:MAG: FAD-dependent oxidoreductase [Clostridia bacterium]|nr:FAD-dependent oxidoreductase [Clostridia bacterium]